MTTLSLASKGDLAPTSPGLPMPRALRRAAKSLMSQQCWNWGRDIAHPDGNALLRYGFTRQRAPEGELGATTYTFSPVDGVALALWGFGFFYGENGRGIYVGRFGFEPKLSSSSQPPRAWSPLMLEACDGFYLPQSVAEQREANRLLACALAAFGDYETWALEALGEGFRGECLRQWNEPKTISPLEVPARWHDLARRFDAR